MEDKLARKTYIAIHTYMSDDAKKQMLTTPYEEDKETDVEFEKRWTFETCKCVAAWMGNDDFFFCHWEAEKEQDIHDALALNGLDQFCVTACYRIHSHIDTNALTGKIRSYPPWKD